jgi:hypothetical protein
VAGIAAALPRLHIGVPDPGRAHVSPGAVLQQWLDHQGRLIATGGRRDDNWWMHWQGLATFRFSERGSVRAEPIRNGLETELRDSFVRGVIPVVLLARGFEALHASAVVVPQGVVALCGTSGTGKSTTALAIAAQGVRHYSDDTVIYQVLDGQAVASAMPFPVRVDATARQVVGVLPREIRFGEPRVEPKSERLHRIYHMVRDAAVSKTSPEFVAVSPARRFELLLTHSHPFDMGGDRRRRAFIENLMTVAKTVDVWECRFAPSLPDLPALAAGILRHAQQEPA